MSLSINLFNIVSISSWLYKCFTSSLIISNLGSLKSLAGLYFINPYKSQASLNDPFKTFKMFLKYAGAKFFSSQSSVINELSFTLVSVDNLYLPSFGLI